MSRECIFDIVIQILGYHLIVMPAKAGIHCYISLNHGSPIKPPIQALEGDEGDETPL